MIFPYLETEKKLQTNEKTRLNAVKSYLAKGETAITNVEIEPEAGAGFVSVMSTSTKDFWLDWTYETAGTKTVSLKITNAGGDKTVTTTIEVVTASSEHLFSDDQDIAQLEKDILKYVPDGKNNLIYVHREAQKQILEYLYRNNFVDTQGNRLTAAAIVDIEEVRHWSKYLALRLMFANLSNAIGDIFEQKSKYYQNLEVEARNKSILKIDLNGDGVNETYNVSAIDLIKGW